MNSKPDEISRLSAQHIIDYFATDLSEAATEAKKLMPLEGLGYRTDEVSFEVDDLENYERGDKRCLRNHVQVPIIYYQNGVIAVLFEITPNGHTVFYVNDPHQPKYVANVIESQLPCNREKFIQVVEQYRQVDHFSFEMKYLTNVNRMKITKTLV